MRLAHLKIASAGVPHDYHKITLHKPLFATSGNWYTLPGGPLPTIISEASEVKQHNGAKTDFCLLQRELSFVYFLAVDLPEM